MEGQNSSYLLKMVKHVKENQKAAANGAADTTTEFVGAGLDHSMIFNAADVAGLIAENVPEATLATSQDGECFRTLIYY